MNLISANQHRPLTPLEIRYKICQLQHEIFEAAKAGNFQAEEFPLIHTFLPGKYIRSIFLPAGTVIIGKIHKFEHPHTLWSGRVHVLTEQDGREEIVGCFRGMSPAGVKRAIYVHEDTIWSVYHDTDLTDLAEIEKQVIAKSYTELGWEDPVQLLKLTTGG